MTPRTGRRLGLFALGIGAAATTGIASAKEPPPARPKTEVTPAPVIGGTTDMGFGGGVIGSVARVAPGYEPYVWRVEFVSTTMVKPERGKLRAPFIDDYVLATFPHVVPDRLRVELRASFTRESTTKYYGLGNASTVPQGERLDAPEFEYVRTHPTFSGKSRIRLGGPIWAELGVSYTYNALAVPADGKLAEDARSADPFVSERAETVPTHGVLTFGYGLEFDTRDDEISPSSGAYLTTRLDLSPGASGAIPYQWSRSDTSLRYYVPLGHDGSTIAMRVVGDLLFGDPPIYELARFDSKGAFGGPNGVRGVPGQRYHGMIKVFGNLELRKMLTSFHLLGKENGFGVAAFVDTGRLWAGYTAHPELDGTSLGLKVGVGGGVRVTAGRSFALRGDIAWSPDARPVGAYLGAGQAF